MSFNPLKIVQSYTKPLPEGEEWYKKRLEACISCPFNTNNIEDPDWISKKVSSKLDFKSKGVCSICKCPVDRKTSVKSEVCSLKSKGQEPKWESIIAENFKGSNMVIELHNTNVFKLNVSGKSTIIKGITSSPTESMNIIFEGYKIKTATPSCGCMVLKITELEKDNKYDIRVLIDTTGFQTNAVTKRSIEIEYFSNSKTKSHTIPFEITRV